MGARESVFRCVSPCNLTPDKESTRFQDTSGVARPGLNSTKSWWLAVYLICRRFAALAARTDLLVAVNAGLRIPLSVDSHKRWTHTPQLWHCRVQH